jgi:hypothetical protein
VAAAIALTGPIRYRDLHLPFPDTVAHAILFYGLSLLMLGALPRSRTGDLILALLAIGGASEVAQGLVGRDMELGDLAADCLGVAAAFLPTLLGRFRALARLYPDVPFSALKRDDRRGGGRQPATAETDVAEP